MGGRKNPFTEVACEEAEAAENAAIKLLKALDENRYSWEADRDELLEKCSAAFHDENHEFPIIYGDYYFIEAVFRLTGEVIIFKYCSDIRYSSFVTFDHILP